MANDIARIATWLQPQAILLEVDAQDRPHALEIAAGAKDAQINLSRLFRSRFRRVAWRVNRATDCGA